MAETLTATDMLCNRRMLRLVSRLADVLYKKSTHIIVVTPGFKANLIAKKVPPQKITIIPNGAGDVLPKSGQAGTATEQQQTDPTVFSILYAGNMGRAQGLEVVLQAAQRCQEQQQDYKGDNSIFTRKIRFVLVGGGVERESLLILAKQWQLNNVEFHGVQTAEAMPGFYARANALLVHLLPRPLFRITIPAKIYACLAQGKPVLAGVQGDAAKVIRKANAGLLFQPACASSLLQVIEKLISMSSAERTQLGLNGLKAFNKYYNNKVLINQHEQLFTTISNRYHRHSSTAINTQPGDFIK